MATSAIRLFRILILSLLIAYASAIPNQKHDQVAPATLEDGWEYQGCHV